MLIIIWATKHLSFSPLSSSVQRTFTVAKVFASPQNQFEHWLRYTTFANKWFKISLEGIINHNHVWWRSGPSTSQGKAKAEERYASLSVIRKIFPVKAKKYRADTLSSINKDRSLLSWEGKVIRRKDFTLKLRSDKAATFYQILFLARDLSLRLYIELLNSLVHSSTENLVCL